MQSTRARFGSLLRAIRDRGFRRDLLWRRLPRPAGVFQIGGDTAEDRYPDIFRFVRDRLGGGAPVRLLSFGCSTGEEVFTLRRYFPDAVIDGLDINPYRIKTCRERLRRAPDSGLRFNVAGSARHLPALSYDAVFCLAVLRQGALQTGPAPRCDHLIRFADFARLTAEFATCLRPGGLLAIAHSNFSFADTPTAAAFEVVLRTGLNGPDAATPLYGPDNALRPGESCRDLVFRKQG